MLLKRTFFGIDLNRVLPERVPQNPDNVESDGFLTVKQFGQYETKVKGSRFIGRAKPVGSRAEAEAFVADVAKQHFDASHNCFAYRVGVDNNMVFRYGDDGEPAGTAGRPILKAIEGSNLTNTALVVTRYFGGTKLGTGGLARAYSECAKRTLESAGRIERFLTTRYMLSFPYELQNVVMNVIVTLKGEVLSSDYANTANLLVSVRRGLAEEFEGKVKHVSSGKVEIRRA